jgi:Co/Zn/Cd efflux system component
VVWCGGGVHPGNVNVRAALIHVLGDCIQSVGIIGAAVVVWVYSTHVIGLLAH